MSYASAINPLPFAETPFHPPLHDRDFQLKLPIASLTNIKLVICYTLTVLSISILITRLTHFDGDLKLFYRL